MAALESLYGAGHVNAVRARESETMPGRRDQVVCTPQAVIYGLLAFWPEGVEYDPCSAEESIVPAARSTRTRGLLDPWPPRTFCNPPYGASLRDPERDGAAWAEWQAAREAAKAEGRKPPPKPPGLKGAEAGLKDWLEMSLRAEGETILLAPNRSHRAWMRRWKRRCLAIIELDPLAFLGHSQAFPAPLVLGLTGCYTPSRIGDFERAFAHLGDIA